MIPSLRVAVFGITRSGKDYSISSAVRTLRDSGIAVEHFEGIPTVRGYSEPMLGKEFAITSMEERGLLMDEFRKRISDRSSLPYLIQDEHYSFPTEYGGRPLKNEYTKAKFPFVIRKGDDGREYEVVLREEWVSDCDIVFYLNPEPGVILGRIRSSEGSKRNEQITEDDIDAWKRFEISSLKDLCSKLNVRFEVLNMNEGAADILVQEVEKKCTS